MVGVDFDVIGGASPNGWTLYSGGGPQTVLNDLTIETSTPPFAAGTIEIVDGIVTLAGDTWPSWAANARLVVSGVSYSVNTRDSDSQLTLDDTMLDVSAGATYELLLVGNPTPYDLSISTTGTAIASFDSANPISSTDLPNHGVPLDELGGYISTVDDTLTFVWSDLDPATVYQVYVFGHADMSVENLVTVVGGQWNGIQQTYNFTQMVAADGLVVGDNVPGNNDLSTYSLLVISDASGEITITVAGTNGGPAALAGLAIAPTKVGSITGQKWNDANGNLAHDGGEAGLEGWVIYLDVNNDGQLNATSDQEIVVQAPIVPQQLQDGATVKNDLFFTEVGQIIDINVSLDIDHTYDADLDAYLISPTGTRVKLFSDIGLAGDNFRFTTIDDEAATAITSSSPPYTGTFRPEPSISPVELVQFPLAAIAFERFRRRKCRRQVDAGDHGRCHR